MPAASMRKIVRGARVVMSVMGAGAVIDAKDFACPEKIPHRGSVDDDCPTTQAPPMWWYGACSWLPASIIEYAAGHDIDLIVMGTHGRGGMAHLLLGSVAERVVKTAPYPVLTIGR